MGCMADDSQAPVDAGAVGSASGTVLPEPLRKGILTAIVAVVLAVVAFLVVNGTESLLLTLFTGFVTTAVLFTTVYTLADS